jgi:uncharacterized protein YdiU (UPF0061 family)
MACLNHILQPSRLTGLSPDLYENTQTESFAQPAFAHLNDNLLEQLGIDVQLFAATENLDLLNDSRQTPGLQPISTVYAGHQFGVYTSRLGDGRVHILGDISARDGTHWEIQLKGAGATPYARGNNGRMSLAEAITEYLGSEAIAGLGIAGTRALALITNNARPLQEGRSPETILVRTATTHLRFGHVEYLHNQNNLPLLKALVDHVITQYYPALMAFEGASRYAQFLYAVTQRTARLLAQWQAVGFVHSVMNTDNMSIIGLTLDYGVYGFMETYDPGYSPNANDEQDRYAFDQQVDVGRWNCLALAEALGSLLPEQRIPVGLLRHYRINHTEAYQALMRQKLGLREAHAGDGKLIAQLLLLLQQHRVDYTRFFRHFSRVESAGIDMLGVENPDWLQAFQAWLETYRHRLTVESSQPEEREAMMLDRNPKYILRQAELENVIRHAEQAHDFVPLQELLTVLQSPFSEHTMQEHLA